MAIPSRWLEKLDELPSWLAAQFAPAGAPVGLHEPELGSLEEEALVACVRSGFVSSVGPAVREFEQRLAAFTGAGEAVAVVNATAGLQVALRLCGVRPGDEVIVPAVSFIASANAIVHLGAVPHFVDIEPDYLGLDPEAVRRRLKVVAGGDLVNRHTGARIAAILPVHVFGHACRIEEICAVAEEFGLPVVEDAAESLGSHVADRHTGRFGRAGVLSFNGNKIITTGGGGAIITDDLTLANHARHLTSQAKCPHPWEFEHDEAGFNFRMPNVNAALGLAQMERLPELLRRKRRLAAWYASSLSHLEGARFFLPRTVEESNCWLNAISLDLPDKGVRDALLGALHGAGVLARPLWNLLPAQKPFRGFPAADVPMARAACARFVNLPSSARLADFVS